MTKRGRMTPGMKRALLVGALAAVGIALLLVAGGCSLLKVTRTAPPPAPIKPVEAHELTEAIRQAADYSEREWGRVYACGASPLAPAVAHAQAVSAVVTTHLGKPAEPLPLAGRAPEAIGAPLGDEVPAWAIPWTKAVTSLLAQDSEETAAYEARLDRYGRTPVKTGWRLSSPALGGLFGTAVLALVLLVVVNVLRGKLGFLSGTLRQVVNSVQAGKRELDASNRAVFGGAMSEAQDTATELLVSRIKKTGKA